MSSSPSTMTKPVKTEAGAEADGGSALLNITVTSQTAPEAFFRIKRDVRMRRLMDLYCGKNSFDPKTVVFLGPEGVHIKPHQTAEEVGLQDGDEISKNIHQNGGAAPAEHSGHNSA